MNDDPPAVAKTTRKRKSSSISRSMFLQLYKPCLTDPTKRTCIVCGLDVRYLYGTRLVSTLMKTHLADHPTELALLESSDARHSSARKHLLHFISTGSLSFSLVDNPEFRQFVATLDPNFVVPSRKTLSTTLLDEEYCNVIDFINSRVRNQEIVVTFDHWSSKNNNHSLMGSTAHTISSEWERELIVLSLEEVDGGSHNSIQVCEY